MLLAFALHVANCTAALGEIPSFRCQDGQPIVSTLDREPITAPVAHCDRPSLAAGAEGCFSGGYVGRIRRGNVDWVFHCRKGASAGFGPVALIGADASTGATCFFDASRRSDGDVVSPASPQAETFWSEEVGNSCIHCHGGSPWLSTPYVPKGVLPTGRAAQYRPIDVTTSPPWIVGPRHPDGKPDRTCTACHRITTGFYGDTLVPYVTGAKGLRLGGEKLSPWAKTFPQSHRMPPNHRLPTESAWDEKYGAALARLTYCLENDDETRCLPRTTHRSR